MTAGKGKAVSLYLPKALDGERVLRKLAAEAKREGRSLNWVIARALLEHVKRQEAK